MKPRELLSISKARFRHPPVLCLRLWKKLCIILPALQYFKFFGMQPAEIKGTICQVCCWEVKRAEGPCYNSFVPMALREKHFQVWCKNIHLSLVSILSTSHKKKPDTNSSWINTTLVTIPSLWTGDKLKSLSKSGAFGWSDAKLSHVCWHQNQLIH